MRAAGNGRSAPARRFNPEALRRVRRSRRLSQRQFAQLLRRRSGEPYSASLVAMIEAGHEVPSVRFLETVARAYRVDIRRFFSA